jgi:uroporphyrin-III C-methyltransferase / precorrin-2 dehydrogenase / sirohydrochlorin ferrochelatase
MTLPVGLDLTGRHVVAVGGGPAALTGIRSLVQAGGLVHVVAPWVCEGVQSLVAGGDVSWSERDYAGPVDLEGTWLALAGSGDALVDDAVRTDALAARVWCFGAPSTAAAGSRPDAGCTAALPATRRVTTPDGEVTVAVHTGEDRWLGEGVAGAVDALVADGRLDLRRRGPREGVGWVALVGGGPGPDGLLTTRGRELLASADVVVIDRLAPRGVVDALPASVRVIDVGKSPGHHALPQDRINDLLAEHALAGRAVVRLKGGDPYVLGRGAEERLA